jgi:NTE family protein
MSDSSSQTLGEWLKAEDFALTMSSGFFGFFAHCGALKALEENDLRPVMVSGSSAGALIVSCWAAGLSAEEIAEPLADLKREDFWDPWPGLGLLRGRKFELKLEDMLPVRSFEECRVPVKLSIFDVLTASTRVLDSGALIPAIRASCAVPGLFHPVWIGWRPALDGGLRDRPGLLGIPENTRLFYHHLVDHGVPYERQIQNLDSEIPRRENMASLAIFKLPRLGPSRLEERMQAFQQAYEMTLQSLSQPLCQSRVVMGIEDTGGKGVEKQSDPT